MTSFPAAQCAPADAAARLPFTDADILAADTFHRRERPHGVSVALMVDHAEFPEVLEVCTEGTAGRDPARWFLFRDGRGAWADDFDTGERHGPGTMAELLAVVAGVLTAERMAKVDTIPPTLIPSSLAGLAGWD